MDHRVADAEASVERMQRRWFAAFKAASVARGECETLLEEMERLELSWNDARSRLAELELLRDSLAEALEAAEGVPPIRSTEAA